MHGASSAAPPTAQLGEVMLHQAAASAPALMALVASSLQSIHKLLGGCAAALLLLGQAGSCRASWQPRDFVRIATAQGCQKDLCCIAGRAATVGGQFEADALQAGHGADAASSQRAAPRHVPPVAGSSCGQRQLCFCSVCSPVRLAGALPAVPWCTALPSRTLQIAACAQVLPASWL